MLITVSALSLHSQSTRTEKKDGRPQPHAGPIGVLLHWLFSFVEKIIQTHLRKTWSPAAVCGGKSALRKLAKTFSAAERP